MPDDRRQLPPLHGTFGTALARLAEPIYSRAISVRNRAYDAGRSVRRFDCPVISIGNLSVGGTGKTPMTALIARWLLDAGRRPAIVMRGYKSKGGASDEQLEYQSIFASAVPVAAHPDRVRSIARLLGAEACDCVLLDDAFQHRRVHRDADIVLIDATRDPFSDRLLPAGWLREPVASLARTHAVVLTHADRVTATQRAELLRRIRAVAPGIIIAQSRHAWAGLDLYTPGKPDQPAEHQPVSWLSGRPILAACGIGNPAPFLDHLNDAGARTVRADIRPDHHHWSRADADALARAARDSGAEIIATTAKDWVKLRSVIPANGGLAAAVPRLELLLTDAEHDLRALITHAVGRAPAPPGPPS